MVCAEPEPCAGGLTCCSTLGARAYPSRAGSARIAQDDAVTEQRHVGSRQHTAGAGDGDISAGDGLITRRCAEAIQMRSQPGDRV
jgi:hypothetical protein